jgi:GDPmannose 4,6-dehydratase
MDAKRDWGYAPEFVDAMWRMLQQDAADDFVVATGETHTVREFTEIAFREVGIELRWEGTAENEKGLDAASGKILVEVSPSYYRPTEVELLIGDPTKAREKLGWEPQVKFEELVRIMAAADLEKVKRRGY